MNIFILVEVLMTGHYVYGVETTEERAASWAQLRNKRERVHNFSYIRVPAKNSKEPLEEE